MSNRNTTKGEEGGKERYPISEAKMLLAAPVHAAAVSEADWRARFCVAFAVVAIVFCVATVYDRIRDYICVAIKFKLKIS